MSAACLHPGGLELTDRQVAAAGLAAGAAALDVGCGEGATVAHLVDAHGLRATGLDASAGRFAGLAWPGRTWSSSPAGPRRCPFADASFEAVVCECVLSTLPDPSVALAEMARVLRPGGAALVSDLYVRLGSPCQTAEGRHPALGQRERVDDLLEAAALDVSLWSDESALGAVPVGPLR